jgi:hypothetical protein
MAEYNWGQMHQDATTVLTGEFPVVFVDAQIKKTNAGDKDMIKFVAKIESGSYVDRELQGNFTISPESHGAMRFFFTDMAKFGLDAAFFATNPTLQQIADALVGRRAVAVVGSREWNGREMESVESWKPALGGPGGSAGVLGGLPGLPAATLAAYAEDPWVGKELPKTDSESPAPTTGNSSEPVAETVPATAPPERPF